MLTDTHTIVIPDWVWGFASIGLLGIVFYLGRLYHELTGICRAFPGIKEGLVRISEILLQKGITSDRVYAAAGSPVRLTPQGIAALKEAQFQAFYDKNKAVLINRILKNNIKTKADIEEAAKQVMLQIEDTLPGFEPIKQYAYSHGEPIAQILFACAIALRDLAADELKIQDNPPPLPDQKPS